jgi:DNA polymerase-4/protein ImuB
VWLPRLPLRVQVLRQPAWDGQPLVLGGAPGERKVVQLCSPEAEQVGIFPGLPLREVLALCREAIILQPDPVRTQTVLEEVQAALQQVAPAVEQAEDRLFLDLRGLERVYHGDLARLEAALRAAVPPLLRPRLGVAGGKFAAWIAARVAPPAGLRVVPAENTAHFLAPLPVAYLVEDGMLQLLKLLGLCTVGHLAALPFSAVQAQFGPRGARAWRLARGIDEEPVVPRRQEPEVHASLRLDDPLASVEAVMAALDQLLAQAFSSPALCGRSVRQARLRALLSDGTSWERLFIFKEALSSREAARFALRSKLELPNGLPPAAVEELALELTLARGEAARQPSLFTARAKQHAQITEAARQLYARYGRMPLYHIQEVEPWSRIPERRWALVACDQ